MRRFARKQTHYFEFKPKKQGVFEYALHNKRLFNPESTGPVMFPSIVAGLEQEDELRIQLRVFSDLVAGDIFTLVPIVGNFTDDIRARNERALAVAEAFLSDLRNEGFADWDVRIEQGPSFLSRTIIG